MHSGQRRFARRFRERLWAWPALAAAFAIAWCVAAYFLGWAIEADEVAIDIGEESLIDLFGVFASTMLTVATFTLMAILTSANAVTSTTTPRATRFVISDGRELFVLAAFIAAVIYSIVGILALTAVTYGGVGRFALFIGLMVIIAVVLLAFVSWVDQVLQLGRQETVLERLSDATLNSITPDTVGTFGAVPWDGTPPPGATPIHAPRVGHVVAIYTERANELAEKHNARVVFPVRPGEPVDPTLAILWLNPANLDENVVRAFLEVVEVGNGRQHDFDVRFNLLNLGEVADRALSPGVNDPGTAINVMHLQLRALHEWAEVRRDAACSEVRFPRVSVPAGSPEELVHDAFTPIARDGAGFVEVGVRLQKTLATLGRFGVPELAVAARRLAGTALELAEEALVAEEHKQRVRAAALAAPPMGWEPPRSG